MKVLLVDDTRKRREILTQVLSREGYDVTAYENGKLALDAYQKDDYPLVISDIVMPVMDGYELCRQIRKLPQGQFTVFLMITSYGSPEVFQNVLNVGADDYLTEPEEIGILRVRLKIAQQLVKTRQQIKKQLDELSKANHIICHSPTIVFQWKAEAGWPVEYVSENVLQFGYTPDDFYNKKMTYSEIIHQDDLERVKDEVNQYNQKNYQQFNQLYRIITKSGGIRWVDDRTKIIRDKQGQTLYYQGIVIDSTDRKKSEEALEKSEEKARQMEHLASLGQFSATIAHEIRNPLGSIHLNFEYLADQFHIKERDGEAYHDITLAIERIQDIIKGILDFSRPPPPNKVEEDIHIILDSSLHSVENDLNQKDINIIKHYDATPLKVVVDVNQIIQVFSNIFINALQAMPEGGDLILTTKLDETFVLITIEDTGRGISEENLDKIFKPFYTTRTKGIGLGLAVVKRIIDHHHGYTMVESMVDVGTKFTIKLPKKD